MSSGNYEALIEELRESNNSYYMNEYADYMEIEKNLAPERIYNVLGLLKRFDRLASVDQKLIGELDNIISKVPESERNTELWRKLSECRDLWVTAKDQCKTVLDDKALGVSGDS